MEFVRKTIDASSAGLGDLAVGLWIGQGARDAGEQVSFVSSPYNSVIEAFGFTLVSERTDDCMVLGGASEVYNQELGTAADDQSSRTVRWQRTMSWDFAPSRPRLFALTSAATEWAEGIAQGAPPVVIAPRAAYASRSLALQKWIRVAWALREEGVPTIAIDRQKDIVEPFPFYAYGYDWHHLMALILLSSVVAGNDSGIPHLAATLGKPTVVAIGPTSESIVFGHCSDVVRAVTRPDVECFGCHFKFEKGYRVACDHGCEALSMISWRSLKRAIEDARCGESVPKDVAFPWLEACG